MICDRPVDLFLLYINVKNRGGYDVVCNANSWPVVAENVCAVQQTMDAGVACQSIYREHLLQYARFNDAPIPESDHMLETGQESRDDSINVKHSVSCPDSKEVTIEHHNAIVTDDRFLISVTRQHKMRVDTRQLTVMWPHDPKTGNVLDTNIHIFFNVAHQPYFVPKSLVGEGESQRDGTSDIRNENLLPIRQSQFLQ